MNKSPKISILIPSLNVAKYIKKCIYSVINQSLKDIEIICIDAGSADGTIEILESFAKIDSRINLIHSNVKSYGYQMNLGLYKASGDYIGIVESDDYVDVNMFASLYNLAIENSADIVMSNYFLYQSESSLNTMQNRHYLFAQTSGLISSDKKDLAILSSASIWANLYRRKVLCDSNVRFVESPGASFQDTSFSIKAISVSKRIVITQDSYYHYCIDNENSSVHSNEKVFCICDEMEDACNFIEKKQLENNSLNEILWRKKFDAYNWNIGRLAKENAIEFTKKMSSEFAHVAPSRILKSYLFNGYQDRITLLINDPIVYFLTLPSIDRKTMQRGEDEQTIQKVNNYFHSKEKSSFRAKINALGIKIKHFF